MINVKVFLSFTLLKENSVSVSSVSGAMGRKKNDRNGNAKLGNMYEKFT